MPQIPFILYDNLIDFTVSSQLPKPPSEETDLLLRQSSEEHSEWCSVYLHLGSDDSSWYLHVEIDIDGNTTESPRRKRKGKKKDFNRIVSELSGESVNTTVTGTFVLPEAAVANSPIIQFEEKPLDIPGVKVRMRGASMEVNGLPIRRIDWRATPTDTYERHVEIRIIGNVTLSISDNYLEEAKVFLLSCLSMVCPSGVDEYDDDETDKP